MFGGNEIVFFAVDEESRDKGFLYMLSDWVQVFNVKVMLNRLQITLSFMVDFTKLKAIPLKTDSPPPCFSASYFDSFYKFEKGESKTTQPISWLVSAYIKAVTAPILLPQMPILLTVPNPLK